MDRARSATVGPQARHVAIPKDFFSDPPLGKSRGVVTLPLHVWWSEPARTFDLSVAEDLRRAYGLILAEGTETDVREFINPELLMEVWDELLLPVNVRAAWEEAFAASGANSSPR